MAFPSPSCTGKRRRTRAPSRQLSTVQIPRRLPPIRILDILAERVSEDVFEAESLQGVIAEDREEQVTRTTAIQPDGTIRVLTNQAGLTAVQQ